MFHINKFGKTPALWNIYITISLIVSDTSDKYINCDSTINTPLYELSWVRYLGQQTSITWLGNVIDFILRYYSSGSLFHIMLQFNKNLSFNTVSNVILESGNLDICNFYELVKNNQIFELQKLLLIRFTASCERRKKSVFKIYLCCITFQFLKP